MTVDIIHGVVSSLALQRQNQLGWTTRRLRQPNSNHSRDGTMKLRMKISGGFRSTEGAADFATIRSFLYTARKQGWNIVEALSRDPAHHTKRLRTA
jgi:transposase